MPAGIFLMILTFFFFNFIKIHVRLWLSCFVSLGLIVLMLLGRKEGRFFLIFQNQKNKINSYPPLYGKLENIENSGLRQSKEEAKP